MSDEELMQIAFADKRTVRDVLRSIFDLGKEQGRADVIDEIYEAVENMYYSTETRNLNDLEYGFNQGLGKVQDFLEQLKEKANA